MAKKFGKENKDAPKSSYADEVKLLKAKGPARLYFLWGQEDYLRDQFIAELEKLCLPDGESSFGFHRINGPDVDPKELRNSVDALPFLSDRTYVEIRDADLGKADRADAIISALGDIPDFCTVVFAFNNEYEPDGRLKLTKFLRSDGHEICFARQAEGRLSGWVARRFEACGKQVDSDAAMRLIFLSGSLMNRLIPEIEKIAAYAKGDRVTVSDVDAVANRIPEANVFELTSLISARKFNSAASFLADIMADKDNDPIFILAILGAQMRRLYAARLAIEKGKGAQYLVDEGICKTSYVANKELEAARGYTRRQLAYAVRLCADSDYKMKRSTDDTAEILKEAVMRICAKMSNA